MLPPRFAVLPESRKDDPEVGLLGQAGLSVLFYRWAPEEGAGVVFADLETALAKIDAAGFRRGRA